MESSKGTYHLPDAYPSVVAIADSCGLHPLLILLYGNRNYGEGGFPALPEHRRAFVGYADFTVCSLPGVGLWEIWNEWNFGIGTPTHEPGDPEDYVRLLSETYRSLKPRYPEKVFLGGSMAGIGRADAWTRRALDAGMLRHLDGLSFHPYVYWMSRHNRVPERGMLGLVAELEGLLSGYPKGREVPLYVTEIGWPTHDAREGVSLRQQADYLSRALLLLRANPRIRGVWVHTLKDRTGPPSDMEAHFGLLFPDGSPKPSWFSFRDTARLLERIEECRRVDFGEHGDGIAGVELVDRAGRRHLAMWTIDEGQPWVVEFACRTTPLGNVLQRSVVGGGAGPAVRLAPGDRGGKTGSVTATSSPTILFDVGRDWRIRAVRQRYEESSATID